MNPYTDVQFLTHLVSILSDFIAAPDFTPRGKFYMTAVCSLGTDASPNDVAPDEYGCAETVDTIHCKALGNFIIPGKLSVSTMVLYKAVVADTAHWKPVATPERGDLVISPTGYGNGKIIGHVGVVAKDGHIMSSDSYSGFFKENYTLETWKARYVGVGNLPMKYFRRV